MLIEAIKQIKTALVLLILLTILTGFIYPLAMTGLAQHFFPSQANGSLIESNHTWIGSKFIGQYFTSPTYFWGRPSMTKPFPYNGASSSGSNSGPSNPDFLATVKERIALLQRYPHDFEEIPVDLVTASGSGLDPDISPMAAFYQAARIADARHIPKSLVEEIIENHIQNRTFGLLGEARVNVLELNLALDQLK